MNLDELKAALEPFAKFANMFEHHMATIPDRGEMFYVQELAINGQSKRYQLNVDQFFAAREALEFLKTLPEESVDPASPDEAVTPAPAPSKKGK